jgi:hydroxyacylglutathione hydrolase
MTGAACAALLLIGAVLTGCRPIEQKRGTMIFETVIVGELGVNCYLLADSDTKEGVVIDPGAEAEKVLAVVKANGVRVLYVLNTHGHFDHIGGNRRVTEATGGRLMISREDEPFLSLAARSATMYGLAADNSPPPAAYLAEGDSIRFGRHELQVIHIPGHSAGGCCFYLKNEGILISGDSLFADSIGRTDLPGGSQTELVGAIRSKLLTLPAETRVFPGHGPATTIGHEKKYNPYLGG